jgi:hypothetical protein
VTRLVIGDQFIALKSEMRLRRPAIEKLGVAVPAIASSIVVRGAAAAVG